MKILYIASIRLPTEKAHGVQIMKTCEAISGLGHSVTLAVPNFLFFTKKEDAFDYYKVRRVFSIKRFISVRLIRLGPVGFFLETLIFFFGVFLSSDFWKADYIFSRDEMLVTFSSLFGKKTVWESHTGSYNFFARFALKRVHSLVCISRGLKDFYVSIGFDDKRIVVSPDGVDLDDFKVSYSKSEARKLLNLPLDKKIVLYAGRLDGWKGVETFFESSKSFDDNTMAVVLGGDGNQVNGFKNRYPNVKFLGYKPYNELPIYQRSADILVIPNTAKDKVSSLYTSPLKVFTSMASGVPIVASDLPSIREVLGEGNSILVLPDSPQALLEGINGLLEDESKADIIAKQALLDVSKYSWSERAKSIVSSLS